MFSTLPEKARVADPAISTEKLTKRFGKTLALRSLDLEVNEGEVFGFLGPNGAGKTTTIRLLLGLLRPTSGRASIMGADAASKAVSIHRKIAYIPGDFAIWPWLTGRESLEFLARLHRSVDVDYRDELIERFQFEPDMKGRSYSKGNRQKIAVIAAFASRAELLILDEPTLGLDPIMEAEFRECVKNAKSGGQTVFLSSHMLSEVEAICDRVGILRRGELVDTGTLDQLRHLTERTFEITFTGEPPDLEGIDGVSHLRVTDQTLHCSVGGDVGPVLERLAGHHVTDLISHEASLEEIFLAHYGDGAES